MLLNGKKALVVGFANKYSLAWAVAQAWHAAGAEVGLSYQSSQQREKLETLIQEYPRMKVIQECDVSKDEEIDALFQKVGVEFNGRLDLLLHSVAFAPMEAMKQPFWKTSRKSFQTAHDISAYSLLALSRAALPIMNHLDGGSIIALSYLGSNRVVPNYNVMGAAKASLEASARHLAYEMGAYNIRVNCLSPGAMNTAAARGITGISKMIQHSVDRSPLRRKTTHQEVGDVATFLASDMASSITGQIIYADCGMNIMATFPDELI